MADVRRGDSRAGLSGSVSEEISAGWLRQARDGSTDAWRSLVAGCRDYLLYLANRQWPDDLRAKESPSDVVQQTLLDAHRDFHQFHGQTQEEWLAWVGTILENKLQNAIRKYRAAKRDARREIAMDPTELTGPVPITAPDESPSGQAILNEQQVRLDAAIERLPEPQRTVVRLHHQDEKLGWAEIGERIDRSAEATRKLWERAIERLSEELADESSSGS